MSWKTPITLLVLLGVLLGAAYYGWRTIISPATGSDTATIHKPQPNGPKCSKRQVFHKGEKFLSKDIIVNVYNAGSIANLADDTLTSLGNKGFRRGVADNAPGGVNAINVTILTKDKRTPEVRLVASQFKGRVTFTSGPALAAGIDVIVGDSFDGMNTGAKKHLTLHHAISICASQGKRSR